MKTSSTQQNQVQLEKTKPCNFFKKTQQQQILSGPSRSLRKFGSMNSLKSSEPSSKELKQLRLPSVTGTNKQLADKAHSRKMQRVRSCEILFHNYQITANKNPRTSNFKHLVFIPKSKSEQSSQIKLPKAPQIKIIGTDFKEKQAFRKKEGFLENSFNQPSIKNILDNSHSFKQSEIILGCKNVCLKCKNQMATLKSKIKGALSQVNKIIRQIKDQYQKVIRQFDQMKINFTENLAECLILGAEVDQQPGFLIRPRKLQEFVQELSSDISQLFSKELKKIESRKRSDIGRIIKNTIPKFERLEFSEKSSEISMTRKKEPDNIDIFATNPTQQGQNQFAEDCLDFQHGNMLNGRETVKGIFIA